MPVPDSLANTCPFRVFLFLPFFYPCLSVCIRGFNSVQSAACVLRAVCVRVISP